MGMDSDQRTGALRYEGSVGHVMAGIGIVDVAEGRDKLKPTDPTFFYALSLESIASTAVSACYTYHSACG